MKAGLESHRSLIVLGALVLFGVTSCAPQSHAEPPPTKPTEVSPPAQTEGGAAATEQPANAEEHESMPATPWSVTYHDGSANGFRFWQDEPGRPARFETTPMTPERSSSGTYSGGQPQRGTLSPPQVAALWLRVRRFGQDATLRAESRMMGTGLFELQEPAGEAEFIIARSEALADFDAFLASIVGP